MDNGIGRTRKQGKLSQPTGLVINHYPKSCVNRIWEVQSSTAAGLEMVGRTVTMDDIVVKNFRRRQAAGELLFNKMTKFTYEARVTGSCQVDLVTTANACLSPAEKGHYTFVGNYALFVLGLVRCQTVLDDEAKRRLTLEVETRVAAKRKDGKTNLIESFAELDQVWHMLRNPLENLRKFVADFQKLGKKRRVKHGSYEAIVFEFARTEWLRFRYGIQPIMRDVTEAIEAMKRGHPTKPIRIATRATGEIVKATKLNSTWTDSNVKFDYQDVYAERFSIRAVWYDEWQPTVFSDLGINLVNVAAVGWELTRFSFVVDWFANVGDFIYANIPRSDVNPVGGSSTTITAQSAVRTCGSATNPNPAVWSSVSGSMDGSINVQEFKSRLPGINPPGLVIKSDFHFDNWKRCADLVALIPSLWAGFNFHLDPKWRYDDG